jgi:cellulose synthase operon protein C
MRSRWWCAGLLVVCLNGRQAIAEEPYLEFIHGLQQRQYFDLAIDYLRQIEEDPATPADVKAIVPYEKGRTLLAESRTLQNQDARQAQLDEAQAMFEAFVQGAPDHPLNGQANTERARILLDKARMEVYAADEPANQGNREAFRGRARQYIQQARDVFQRAHDQHQASWESMKGFIPEEEKARRAARDEAEALYMQAQLDLGRTIYEEAQTYDRGTKERAEMLDKAAAAFEEIHQKYRSQIAGLHARMWQAKCFEEQNEIRKALGIYNEILDHPGRSLQDLKDRVRWFRLICLNHEQRQDYQLAIDEATEWRNNAGPRARTDVGLGIQYELAKALESLANQRTTPEATASNLRNQALSHSRAINRYPGPLKAVSGAMIQRLMVALNREPGDPQDFDTAYGTANLLLEDVKKLNAQIEQAQAQGDTNAAQEAEQTLLATAGEMTRLFDLALKLSNARTDPEQINIAHFRLAYSYFIQQKYLEAGVVAGHIARKFAESQPEVARESAFIALASFDRVFSEADSQNRDFEMQQVLDTAELIINTWPESDRAIDARTAVARIYRQADEPEKAAEWYSQVPETAQQYASAQLSAGQSYWNAYLTKASLPKEERPPVEQLADWKEKAEQHLSIGVARRQQQVPAEQPTPDDLVFGKLSLVQIRNSEGAYRTKDSQVGAIELLTEDPHSVLSAVAVTDGEARPTTSGAVKSKAIASLAYQQLLRAHIGTRDLEAARQTREQLEAIAGGGEEAGALTQVYVEFGRELQKELEQLSAAGDTARLNEVRGAFEQFLGDLFSRQDGQTFNSLLWIAETYTGLAEGSEDDTQKAQAYYTKAAETYNQMLAKASQTPGFVDSPGQLVGVRLRLVNCRRLQGDFQEAEDVIFAVLQERPTALEAQFEAARLYEEWAEQGTGDNVQNLQYAISGRKEPAEIWGWGLIAQKLQRSLDFGQAEENYEAMHLDARYHLAKCQLELGKEQTSSEQHDKHLTDAKLGLQRFVAITPDIPEADWKRLESLHNDILAGLGEPPAPLVRPGAAPGEAADGQQIASAGGTAPAGAAPTTATDTAQAASSGGSGNLLMIILCVALGLGAAGGIYMMTVQQEKKRRAKYAAIAKESAASPRKKKPSSKPSKA